MKRLNAPRTWPIHRKQGGRFIIKPFPGGQSLEHTLPLAIILRDLLHKATNRKEVRKILNEGLVMVDEKTRKHPKYPVGLFDTVKFPTINEAYRLVIKNGKLALLSIPLEESNKKIVRINKKKHVKNALIQLGLSDGRNILINKEDKDNFHVGDSLLISVPDQKVIEKYSPSINAYVYIYKGKHSGRYGILKNIEEELITIASGDEEVKTKKEYGIVISAPDKQPVIKLWEA